MAFEKINKNIKPIGKPITGTKIKGEDSKSEKNRGNITNDTTEVKKIIRNYYKQLYANKLTNLKKEKDKFLETYNLPRLNHEEIETLNRTVTN